MEAYRHRRLLDREQIAAALDELSVRLRPTLPVDGVTVVPILGGAMIFAADLVRRLPAGLVMDFIRVQTYGDATSPQTEPVVDWRPKEGNVRGRHVLLLDDILDTGRTITEARRFLLEEMGAAEVTIVVLIDKPARRAVAVEPDCAAIHIEEDHFLVGYGLDYRGRFRNLPELLALETDDEGMPLPAESPREARGRA